MSKECSVCRKGGGDQVCCQACQAPYHPGCLGGCLCCKKKPNNFGRNPPVPDNFLCKLCEGRIPPLQPGDKVLSLLYAFGCNQAGQLGIGKLETKESTPVLVEDTKSVEVVELVAGGWNSMLRTSEGDVYTCGDGENGKLGHLGIVHEQLSHFRIVDKLRASNRTQGEGHISKIALGRDHACAITSEGHMYTWGNGEDGKCGHQDMSAKKVPTKLSSFRELEQPITDLVSLGHTFSMCIGVENILMAWGGNQCGQLGTGDMRGKWVPQMINPDQPERAGLAYYTKNTESTYDIVDPIKELAAGKSHALALTNMGGVWAWGNSAQGQTGMGEEKVDPDDLWARNYKNLVRPKLVPGLASVQVELICAGGDHCLALGKEGQLWGWGANNFGQLGLGNTKSIVWEPVIIDTEELLGRITQLSAGEGHSGCVTNVGDVYTWGDGREGQLGHGTFESLSKPKLVKLTRDPEAAGQTPVLVCGGFHTFILLRTKNKLPPKTAAKASKAKAEKKTEKEKKAPVKAKAEKAKPEKAKPEKGKKGAPKKAAGQKRKKKDDSESDTETEDDSDAPLKKGGKKK